MLPPVLERIVRWFWPQGTVRSTSFQDVLNARALGAANPLMVSPDSAVRRVAVMSSINLIASTVAELPTDVFTGKGAARREVTPPRLLDDPEGEGYGLSDFVWKALFSVLLRGNAFGYIAGRDSLGYPTVVQMQHPDQVLVTIDQRTGRRAWVMNGKEVPADKVWHWRPFPVFGEVLGLSPIGLHAVTVGLGLAAERFGAEWFTEGGHPSAMLSADSPLTPDQAQIVKATYRAATRSNGEPLVVPAGIKYQQLQIAPGESQFLDVQQYTSAECARIFGPGMPEMLGYETGGSMTYANVEQRSLHLLTFALGPWITRLERQLSGWLPRPRYLKFNTGSLLRTATLDRYRAHDIAIRAGFETVNEARALEDRPPVGWGDEPGAPNEKQEQPAQPPEGAEP